jgi:hypothetical protein
MCTGIERKWLGRSGGQAAVDSHAIAYARQRAAAGVRCVCGVLSDGLLLAQVPPDQDNVRRWRTEPYAIFGDQLMARVSVTSTGAWLLQSGHCRKEAATVGGGAYYGSGRRWIAGVKCTSKRHVSALLWRTG